MSEAKDVRFQIVMSASDREHLKELAARAGMNESAWIRSRIAAAWLDGELAEEPDLGTISAEVWERERRAEARFGHAGAQTWAGLHALARNTEELGLEIMADADEIPHLLTELVPKAKGPAVRKIMDNIDRVVRTGRTVELHARQMVTMLGELLPPRKES